MQEFNECIISVCTIEGHVNIILYWFVFKRVPTDLFIAFSVRQSDLCETGFDIWINQKISACGVICICQMSKGNYG